MWVRFPAPSWTIPGLRHLSRAAQLERGHIAAVPRSQVVPGSGVVPAPRSWPREPQRQEQKGAVCAEGNPPGAARHSSPQSPFFVSLLMAHRTAESS